MPLNRLPLILLMLFTSCAKQGEEKKSVFFEKAKGLGRVSQTLEEASGLVASVVNPGYLWTINDSGNPAEIFLLNDEAEIVLTCKLNKIENRDWEEIAIGPGPEEGIVYLYIGEIGDNEAKYDMKYVYRIKEPVFEKDDTIDIEDIETLKIVLPDGARDSEAFGLDHKNGDFYLISKREENVNVYYLPFSSLIEKDTLVPSKLATLPYHNTVAIDFSFDSKEVLLKTYNEIYYWKRPDSLSVLQTMNLPPTKLDYKSEPQGESICWNLDGSGFYTLSESVDHHKATLYFYERSK